MDFSNATENILNIVATFQQYVDEINKFKEEQISKINKCLEDLENTINSPLSKSQKWLDMKIAKATKKIQDILDGLKKRIDEIIDQLKKWYDKQIIDIKISVIRGVFAKLGGNCSKDEAIGLANMIPHPSIDSLLPKFNIELELPNIADMVNVGQVKLPRL